MRKGLPRDVLGGDTSPNLVHHAQVHAEVDAVEDTAGRHDEEGIDELGSKE